MKSKAPQKLVPFANVNLMPFKWGFNETIKILVKSHEHSKKERAFFREITEGKQKHVRYNFSVKTRDYIFTS